MRMRGPNNVGRVVQTDPTLLRYASVITEQQKKCWELFPQKFDQFQTSRNNMQLGVQTDATCIKHPTMLGVIGQQSCVKLHRALGVSFNR